MQSRLFFVLACAGVLTCSVAQARMGADAEGYACGAMTPGCRSADRPSLYAQNAVQRAAVRNDVNRLGTVQTAPQITDAMDIGGNKITDAILAKVLPDLRYAAALSKQNSNKVTQPCLSAVLKLVDSWQVEVKDDAGNTLALPEPHVITFLEKQSQLLRQLQPDSDVSIGCSVMAQALKKDLLSLVGGLLSGGALGLFKLPLPFP